jgi:RNA-directed DNA polymerase
MNSLTYKRRQLQLLGSILHCPPAEIEFICDHIESYYRRWEELKKNKCTGQVKTYPDGTPQKRVIRPSSGRLKEIQKSIRINILSKIQLPDFIQGGVKGKSNITNAKQHQGNKYQFATDLQAFFPSVTPKQINQLFLSFGYSHHIAYWLTKLTSLEFQLPQGTSTSTAIANLVFLKTDQKLMALCEQHGVRYTRFVDDLSFSSSRDFRKITVQLLDVVRADGFKISYRKTAYAGHQTLTGIRVFNNHIDAPEKIILKAKEERTALAKEGPKPYSNYLHRIRMTNNPSNRWGKLSPAATTEKTKKGARAAPRLQMKSTFLA